MLLRSILHIKFNGEEHVTIRVSVNYDLVKNRPNPTTTLEIWHIFFVTFLLKISEHDVTQTSSFKDLSVPLEKCWPQCVCTIDGRTAPEGLVTISEIGTLADIEGKVQEGTISPYGEQV